MKSVLYRIAGVMLCILVGFWCASCAHIGTVKPDLDKPVFQAENLPIRELNVLVINNDYPPETIHETIRQTSRYLESQVGIRLAVKGYRQASMSSFTSSQMLVGITEAAPDHERFDLVIAWSRPSLTVYVLEATLGMRGFALIDDTYRKFIFMKVDDPKVLMHEICHAFVFSHGHSWNGVLTGMPLKIPYISPLTPWIFNLPPYLSKKDRAEVLRNKWRNFNKKPPIPEKQRIDVIGVRTEVSKMNPEKP